MNEKTRNQIAEMKKQTIGVEIEMNNISRQKAAKIAATFFGTGRSEYTASRNGYYTWSAWDAQGREWKFSRDVSIAGPDDEKCELVTPILTYADMETFQELLRTLRHAGMKSSPSRGCGVHIHIGLKGLDGRDHNAKTLRNLVNIMAAHETQIGRAIKIDQGRTGHYCKVVNPDFFILTNDSRPTEPRTYRNHFNRLLKQLGIPAIKFHAMRHSFATRCIESDCDYKTVSALLGHASVSTTLNLYVHPNLEQKHRCIRRMCRHLAK